MKKKNKFSFNVDSVFNVVNVTIMIILLAIFIWPLWFVVIASFSDPNAVWMGEVVLWPKGINFSAYEAVLEYTPIWKGYLNSLIYTAAGTCISVFMTILCAYPLSRKDFAGRKVLMLFCVFTMYFGGGLVPAYILNSKLGLVDTVWVLLIPGCLSVYNMLIVRNYMMNSLPAGLYDAAEIDGANAGQYLFKVALPLSTPVLAVVALYYGVGLWNDYFVAMIYLNNPDMYPLQLVLKGLLMSTEAQSLTSSTDFLEKMQRAELMKYATIIVAVVPVLLVYPKIQKYFQKGIMIGSMKG